MQGFPREYTRMLVAILPKDITGNAQTGLWVNLAYSKKCTIFLIQGAWAGGTPAVTLEQATSAAGAGAKALAFDRKFSFAQGSGAPDAIAKETFAPATVSSDTFNLPAAVGTVTAIEIRAGDLDVNNGFKWMRVDVASPGSNADLLCAFYLLSDLSYEGNQPNQPAIGF